jgi:hypothetical protein
LKQKRRKEIFWNIEKCVDNIEKYLIIKV